MLFSITAVVVVVDSEIRPPCAKFQLCYKSST